MPSVRVSSFAGMNSHIAPHLLPEDAAAWLIDADTSARTLRPFRESAAADTPSSDRLSYGHVDRSLVKWGSLFFWSDNATGEVGSSRGYVGILPPTNILTATPRAVGTRFTGAYQYAVTFETALGDIESSPYPIGTGLAFPHVRTKRTLTIPVATEIPPFNPLHYHGHRRFFGYKEGIVVTYNGRTYESISGFTSHRKAYHVPIPERQWPGNEIYWRDLGENPTTSVISGYDEILLSGIPQSSDPTATKINIYRTSADSPTFYLLAQFERGVTEWVDTVSDSSILPNRQLNLSRNALPPIYQANVDGSMSAVGGKYLTELAGTFHLAVGDRLYLSEQSNPHGWSPLEYQTFENDITAISKDDEGILVFSANRLWRVTGSTFADIVVKEIPERQGCPNWRTIAAGRNRVFWESNDGICAFSPFQGRDGRFVTILTENTYDFDEHGEFGIIANDIYYLFRSSDAVCIDMKSGDLYERQMTATSAHYDVNADKLYLINSSRYEEVDAGDKLQLFYVSPAILGDASTLKRVKRIWLDADEAVHVDVVIDGVHQGNPITVDNGNAFFASGLTGRSIQVTLASSGEIRAYTIEFQTLG